MLSWTKLNPTVKQIAVKKLFFNSYLFKAKIYCPGSRLIFSKTAESLLDRLEFRLGNEKIYNYGGSWYRQWDAELRKNFDTDQLTYFFSVKKNNQIKIRVEEPYVNLYSNTEQQLYNIIEKSNVSRLKEIYLPVNENAKEILQKGEIIVNSDEEYSYKIILRSISFENIKVKHSLLDYLYNLEDQIKIPNHIKKHLSNSYLYFPGGYFYSKDDSINTLIRLFCPDLISSIFKLTKLDS